MFDNSIATCGSVNEQDSSRSLEKDLELLIIQGGMIDLKRYWEVRFE